MGNKVAIKHIGSGEQTFLSGHTNQITALCVSPCGNFVASGQLNHLGFRAMVIIWDYNKRTIKSSYEVHKVRVEDVCFSFNSEFLVSLGGRDDGNVVIWNVGKNDAICASFATNETAGSAHLVIRTNIRAQCFVTAGDRTLKVWRINPETRKVYGVDVKVGKLRRSINCVAISKQDDNMYCGTSSGDIIKARLNYSNDPCMVEPVQAPVMVACYSKIPRDSKKMKSGEGELYAGGIKNILFLENEKMIVGTGDGTVELIEILKTNTSVSKMTKLPSVPMIKAHLTENVCSAVTSMNLYQNEYILVGTVLCEIYQIKLSNFDMRLLLTCHTSSIYTIAFPHDYSEIFATGGKNDIRLWRMETQKELLRITVPSFVCSSLCFSYDGRMIISAWNDGIIRAFTPQTGRIDFIIHNAHIKAASAIAVTVDGTTLISGGCDGQVRIWNVKHKVQTLVSILKEHKGPVTSLHISESGEDLISSSMDGTCIIWDITRYTRKQVLMGNTMFMAARFIPNGNQILTCGTDRKIAYWETWDGSLVREVEGSAAGALNCIDITSNGQYFVTGSNDCVVKTWTYDTATITHIGVGHASIISACKISPDNKHIVTVSTDGAILIWRWPFEQNSAKENNDTVRSTSTMSRHKGDEEALSLKDLKCNEENVIQLSQREDVHDTVKTIHNADIQQQLCKCKTSDQLFCTCQYKNNGHRNLDKTEALVKLNSQNSVKDSIKLDKSNKTEKNNTMHTMTGRSRNASSRNIIQTHNQVRTIYTPVKSSGTCRDHVNHSK